MPKLLIPEAVGDMDRKIEQILELLRVQNSLLSQMLPQWTKLHLDLKGLSNLESELGEVANSLAIIKDAVRFN